jgi:uncharacterized protein with PIN domain
MDDRLRRRMEEFSRELALEEKDRLEAAGTLVDLERLTMEIGDELARQLTQALLSARTEEAVQRQVHACPECGKECPVEEDLEPLILQGMRGEIEYQEPRCHCSRCRRAFFPGGSGTGAFSS